MLREQEEKKGTTAGGKGDYLQGYTGAGSPGAGERSSSIRKEVVIGKEAVSFLPGIDRLRNRRERSTPASTHRPSKSAQVPGNPMGLSRDHRNSSSSPNLSAAPKNYRMVWIGRELKD